MAFDLFTLVTTTALVAMVLALVAILASRANGRRELLGPLAWACALAAVAELVRGLNGVLPDPVPIVGGNIVLLLAFGLLWQAVCGLGQRKPPFLAVAAGAVLWVLACLLPPFYESAAARIIAVSLAAVAYTSLSVLELWANRGERLGSRGIVIVAGVGHVLFHLGRIVFIAYLPFPLGSAPQNMSWAAVLAFEGLIYGTITICSLLLIDRERVEQQLRLVADLDPLTGVANRRAFHAAAIRMLADKPVGDSVAVLLFDLDHFKRINDTFGHAAGDEILIRFAHTARRLLGRSAEFGRWGGEEFAAVVRCRDEQAAWAVAEQVRAGFAAEKARAACADEKARAACADEKARAACAAGTDGRQPTGTVSIGVSIVPSGGSIEATLAVADQALYEAKRLGRDRVVFKAAARPASGTG
jgi:diguanylate cyclase (GGDEF)-like protein